MEPLRTCSSSWAASSWAWAADYERVLVDFEEFEDGQYVAEGHESVPEDGEFAEALRVGDRIGDGFISAEELRRGITDLGEKRTHGEVDEGCRR